MVTLVLVLFPVLVLAQDPEGLVTSPHPEANQPILSAAVAPGNADPAGPGQQPAAPPAAIVPAPQRRGSMVGYIDDAVVGSKVRVRFETAFHDHVPDRAEFFYAKCGCYQTTGAANQDPNAPGPAPGVVTDLNFQQMYLQVEYGKQRWSVFGELPTRWIQPQTFAGGGPGFSNQSGIGDVRVGGKFALVSKPDQLATVQVQVYLPSGSASDGLGTHHTSIEPALLLYNSVTDRFVIESQVGWWHPIGGSAGATLTPPVPVTSTDENFAGDVFFYGIGPSFEVYRNRTLRIAPVVELVGWHVLNGFQTQVTTPPPQDAGGTNIVNLKFGGRVVFDAKNSLYAGWGHALTTASWYDDIFRIEYRYSF
jgi:hypothetical protein